MMSNGQTEKVLRLVSQQFRNLCSEALRADPDAAQSQIRRVMRFVAETPLLADAAASAPWTGGDAVDALRTSSEEQERIQLPEDHREDLGFLHRLLAGMADLPPREFSQLTAFYNGVSNIRQSMRALLEDTLAAYQRRMGEVLTAALLDQAGGGNRQIAFGDVSGSPQIVIHQGVGSVQATQTIQHEAAVRDAAEALIAELDGPAGDALEDDRKEELREMADAAREEASGGRPKRFTLKKLKEGFENIAAAATASGVVGERAVALAGHIGTLLERLPR